MFERFTKQAHLVVDLARDEAERCGHRYLGPEHVLLGLLAEGHSAAARILRARGVQLRRRVRTAGSGTTRAVPAPGPSDAELLGTLGIDLDAIRRNTEQRFGVQALGEATWRVTRRPGWRGGRVVWTPLCGPPLVAKRALHRAGEQASALGHPEVRPDHLMLGVLEDVREPAGPMTASRPGATDGSAPTSGCRTATRAPPVRYWRRWGSTWSSCGTPSWLGCGGSSGESAGLLAFVAAYLLVFELLAAFTAWSTSSTGPSGKTPVTVTLAPGATGPAGLAVTDLNGVGQLQARFNADQRVPRLVLALTPT